MSVEESAEESAQEQMSQEEVTHEADQKADAIGVLVIFFMMVAFAVHYVSGWTFDLGF